jgi:hypothetical protein
MSATLKHKSASITLRPLPNNAVWVSNLYSEERMQGHATELMQQLVDKADEQGITLQLDARAYGHPFGMSTGALMIFYESFGFYHLTGEQGRVDKHLMERKPKQELHVFCSVPGHREGWLNEDGQTFWCPDCETTHDVHGSQ